MILAGARILSRAFSSKISFEKELVSKINFTGPMSISQYMQEVLTNPAKGYYTTKEKVLGAPGHFVTSPEISQMFGECVAIWIVHEWMKMGSPRPLQLVELGPGHGTLMQDIIKTIRRLTPEDVKHLQVHLVETSPNLTKAQDAKLRRFESEIKSIRWHSRLSEVPKGFTFFIANEFFDALPIHKFFRDPKTRNWQELLVGTNNEELSFVKARQRTLANQYVENNSYFDQMEAIEISPKSGVVMQTISERIVQYGGAALIADYGYSENKDIKHRDTFRAFKNHKLTHPLKDVGLSDLTADVDFGYLNQFTGENTLTYGPVSQAQFLSQLGISVRCNLLKDHNPKLSEELDQSLDMLINPMKMGTRFKFFSVFSKSMQKIHSDFPPAGFHAISA